MLTHIFSPFFISGPDKTPDAAVAERTKTDEPPVDCEEEKNPYDAERWDELKIVTFMQF